jgi:cytochrome c-type protein NapC
VISSRGLDQHALLAGLDFLVARHCHDQSTWVLERQGLKARKFHSVALSKGKTCIDCHKGLAHKLPEGISEDAHLEGIDDQ